jgi:hypothetical protein
MHRVEPLDGVIPVTRMRIRMIIETNRLADTSPTRPVDKSLTVDNGGLGGGHADPDDSG